MQQKVIKVNDTFKFTYDGFDNVLIVDKIASAGSNPFKKAAYVTFEKYKK